MNAEEKKSPEYLEGFFDGTQKMREIFEKCADDADKLNYDRGRHDAELELALTWKDVRDLLIIAHDYENELLNETPWDGAHDKYTYTEILKRFNERKNKQ